MEPAELLKKYFGYDTFRPMQEDVIKTILSGRDVLAVMPTGAGKSVCFQIPALAMCRTTEKKAASFTAPPGKQWTKFMKCLQAGK